MLDRYIMPRLARVLEPVGEKFVKHQISADNITILSFGLSMVGCALIVNHSYILALFVIIFARLGDALDGIVARINGASTFGAYLDISLDFIFYAVFVAAFGLANVEKNAAAALVLLTGFAATATTFLAYSVQVEKKQLKIERDDIPRKGFFYVEGILEGSETYLFFILMLVFPRFFPQLALVFAVGCYLTAYVRILRAKQRF